MSQAAAHQLNLDAAQRELDRRSAEGEDVSMLRVNPATAAIERVLTAPITLPLQPTTDDLAHFDVAGGFKCSKHLLDPADPIRHRQIIERAIIRRACEDLLAAGFLLSHHDGEAWTVKDSADLSTIMCNIQAADEERIVVRPGAGVDRITPASGAIFLVYGNDGWDVIADHSGWLERYLVGATELSDAIVDATPLTPAQQAHVDFINAQRAQA